MNNQSDRPGLLGRLARFIAGFGGDRRGNVLAIVAISLVPVVGALGMAGEASSWFVINRAMQNAADSSAVAAATAGGQGNTAFANEGRAVAGKYGFVASTANSTSTTSCADATTECVAVNNTVACPDASANTCYQTIIQQPEPLYLLSVVGFKGTTAARTSGGPYVQLIAANAVAEVSVKPSNPCVLALQSGGITDNGASKADVGGCIIASNGQVTCDGKNASIGAGQVLYATTNKNSKCSPATMIASIADPYALTSAQTIDESNAKNCPVISGTITTSTIAAGGCFYANGSISINSVVSTIDPSTKKQDKITTIYINNGNLSISSGNCLTTSTSCSGGTLDTSGAAGLSLVFMGSTGGNMPTSGTLNIAAPTTGDWAGIAIYDPVATSTGFGGNSPAWDLTGLAYFPNDAMLFSGIPNKAGTGYNCFVLVTGTFQINGTGQIFANPTSQCAQAGLSPPSANSGLRVVLVQ